MEKFYSCEQVAERYGVKVATVWAWIREKKLSAVKIGGGYRVRESDLAAFEKTDKKRHKEVKEMPAKINHQSIPGVAKLLLAGDAIPGLKEHFNNPENKRRFKEWQTRRQNSNDLRTTKSQRA